MEPTEEKKRKIKYLAIIALAAVLYLLQFSLNRQRVFLDTDSDTEIGCTDVLVNGTYVEQSVYVDHDFEMVLQLCVITWNTVYDSEDMLIVSIIDRGTGEVIHEAEYRADSFTDHLLSRFLIFEGQKLEAGKWYNIRIASNITDEGRPIAIACVANTIPERAEIICNGEPTDYNLRMKIWE